MSSDVRAGGAYVELFTKDVNLAAGLAQVQSNLHAWSASAQNVLNSAAGAAATAGKALMGMSAGVLGPMVAATMLFADTGGALDDMSARTGVAVESLSGLGFAAEQSGAELKDIETAFKGISKTTQAVKEGNAGVIATLKELGINAADFLNQDMEGRMKLIADGLSKVSDPGRQAALAMRLMEDAGQKLLPLLSQGAAGMEALQREAAELGIVMSAADATQAAELGDAMDRSKQAGLGLTRMIGAALAPALADLFNAIAPVLASATRWINQNRELVVRIAGIAAAVGAAGAGFMALAGGLTVAAGMIGVIASVGSMIASAMVGIITTLGSLITGAVGLVTAAVTALTGGVAGIIAAAFSPAGLALIAIAVAAVALFQALRSELPTVGGMLDWFKGLWGDISTEAVASFQGIAAALQAGEIELAAKILWGQLHQAWLNGIQPLQTVWLEWKAGFLNVITSVTALTQSAWVEMTIGMAKAWNSMQAALLPLINAAQDTLADYIAQAGEALGIFGEGTVETLNEDQVHKAKAMQARIAGLEAENQRLDQERSDRLQAIQDRADIDTNAVNDDLARQLQDTQANITAGQKQLAALRADAQAKLALQEKLKSAGGAAGQSFNAFQQQTAANAAIEFSTTEGIREMIAATRGSQDPQRQMVDLMHKQVDAQATQQETLKQIADNTSTTLQAPRV